MVIFTSGFVLRNLGHFQVGSSGIGAVARMIRSLRLAATAFAECCLVQRIMTYGLAGALCNTLFGIIAASIA